jgi:phage terminase small subunit
MEDKKSLATTTPEPAYEKDLRQLTSKEERFCVEFLKDRNATQAYIRTGYKGRAVRQNAYTLLTKHYIRSKINSLIKEQTEAIKDDIKFITKELIKSATINIADAYDPETNTLKEIHDMPEPLQKAIVAVETEELFDGRGPDRELIGYTKRIKLNDRLQAIELLGKKHKMFTDVHEIPGLENLADRLRNARKRATDARRTRNADPGAAT